MTGTRGPFSRRLRSRKSEQATPTQQSSAPIEPIEPPQPLSDRARRFWNHHRERLTELNLLTHQTAFAFSELAETYSELIGVRERLSSEGRTIIGSNNEIKRHPLVSQEKALSDRLLIYFREFGFTGASKKRILEPWEDKPADDDPFAV